MVKRLYTYILLLCSLTVQAAVFTPQTVPDPKKLAQENYVSNPDRLIADSDVVYLNRCAAMLYRQTEVEMAVVALGSIGDADAFDFAYELFQRWGIGGEGKNTGVLILFAEESHDIRIMTGVGIEGVLPDAKCSRIIRETMIPAFRAGDYGGGLCLGALRIYETCTEGDAPDELRNARSVTNRGQYAEEDELATSEIILILLSVLLVAVFCFVMAWFTSVKRCPHCHKRKAYPTGSEKILQYASYTREGKGERTYKCRHCGETFVLPFTIPRKSRVVVVSGGSGKGGFGGGFSGGGSWGGGSTFGGGAGGKW
ncbi:MAG: TPM domain-containing protein [Paludibacteraceae bacterium]|nr:TPM domain-containing protein [Paludibacteraceae bacterium]